MIHFRDGNFQSNPSRSRLVIRHRRSFSLCLFLVNEKSPCREHRRGCSECVPDTPWHSSMTRRDKAGIHRDAARPSMNTLQRSARFRTICPRSPGDRKRLSPGRGNHSDDTRPIRSPRVTSVLQPPPRSRRASGSWGKPPRRVPETSSPGLQLVTKTRPPSRNVKARPAVRD